MKKIQVVIIYVLGLCTGLGAGYLIAEDEYDQDCQEIYHLPTHEGCIGCEPKLKHHDYDTD